MTTTIDVHGLQRLQGDHAWQVAQAIYDQLLDVLDQVADDQWDHASACTGWTVRDVVAHMVGAARGHASVPTFLRQMAGALRTKGAHDGQLIDALSDLQVRGEADLDGPALREELRRLAPRAVAGRRRTPAPLRALPIPLDVGGSAPEGLPPSIRNGELQRVTLTRDVWIHRFDIADPLGLDRGLRPDVDGVLLADVVAEWAERHGRPFVLDLTGPLAATFRQGRDGERISMDAVEFVLTLSGRRPMTGLLATPVLF